MTGELASNADRGMSQVRLYSPPVLAAYFILGNVPIGMALYGLNVARRRERWLGYVILGTSLVALGLMMVSAMAGGNLRGWRLLSLVLGVGMWQVERAPYRRAVASGAVAAPWWPPLLAVLGLTLVFMLIVPGE